MKLSFDYKGTKVTYYLTYKKAKAISIQVKDNGHINVIAPIGTPVFAVMDKVKGNAPWIISELYGKLNTSSEVKLLEQYTYLGKNYKLEVITNAETEETKVKMVRGKFVVETATDSPAQIREAIIKWYEQKVIAKIKERFKEYKDQFEVMPKQIKIAEDKNVLLRANSEEVMAGAVLGILSVDVMDYVLVSSLCRINCNDEASERLKLQEVLPEYEKSKQWLEENKNILSL